MHTKSFKHLIKLCALALVLEQALLINNYTL